MQTRHRVPTVFSIYMLDVICCALGCVILLWQVSHQEAEEQTAAAAQARDDYERASREVRAGSDEVAKLKDRLAASLHRFDQLTEDLTRARGEHARARAALDLSEAELRKLRALLASLEETGRQTGAQLDKTKAELDRASTALAGKEKLNLDLLAKIALADRQRTDLEKDLAARRVAADEAARRLEAQLALARAAEDRSKKLERALADVRTEGKEAQTKLTASDLRLKLLDQDLERVRKDLAERDLRFRDLLASHDNLSRQVVAGARDLGEAKVALAALKGEKQKLEGDRARLQGDIQAMQRAAEQRFAGIELTGQNVIFLVDMSGSMVLADAETKAPDKWPLVCETIARVMASLPGLQRFQVILFNDKVQYLFGHEGEWLKFDPASTPKVVADTLKKVQPQEDTNMSDAFAQAFRFRDSGLDTIYVISDGLPTTGAGIPAGAGKLSEAQKTEVLSRYLRTKLKTDWNRPRADGRRVRINAIGFFFESPDVGAFLWALARENDGSFVGMSRP